MKIRCLSKMINDELSIVLPWSLIINGIIYLASLPIYKFTTGIPCGLLLGTAAMLLNFILLGYSSERAVERPMASAKRYMFMFYVIRFAIMGSALVIAFKVSIFNPAAAAIPLIYPKIIYTLSPVFKKKGG